MPCATVLAMNAEKLAPWLIGGLLVVCMFATAFFICRKGHPGYAVLLAVVIIVGQAGAAAPVSRSAAIVSSLLRLACFGVVILGVVDMVGRARKRRRPAPRGMLVVMPDGTAGTPPPMPPHAVSAPPVWAPAAIPVAIVAKPRRRRTGLWVALGVIGLVGVLFGVHLATRERTPPLKEDRAEVYKEVAEAFSDPAAMPEGEAAAAITKALEQLPEAIRSGAHEGRFDWDRLVQEIARQKGVPKLSSADWRDFIGGAKRGLPRMVDVVGSCEVRHVRFIADGREAVAITRHMTSAGASAKHRWWLRSRNGGWQVYDWEVLDAGLRVSRIFSATLVAANDGMSVREWETFTTKLTNGMRAVQRGDGQAALRALAGRIPEGLPDSHVALHWYCMAAAEVCNGDPGKALKHLEMTDRYNADMPVTMILRGRCLGMQGNHKAAEREARQYLALLGDDEIAYGILADALAGQDRPAEAAEAYAASLAMLPEQPDLVTSLLLALVADRKLQAAKPINALEDPARHFVPFAKACMDSGDLEALDALVQVYRPIVGASPSRGYYAAQVQMARGQFEQAATILREIMPQAALSEDRPAYAEALMDALMGAGRPMEAYESNPERAEAFWYVGNAAVGIRDAAVLGELITAYRPHAGDDVWFDYFNGEHHMLSGRYKEAEMCFAAGMARRLDAGAAESFRSERVYALYMLGRWRDAYGTVGGPEATFDQLARMLASDEDLDGLATLVELHGAAEPQDRNLRLWRAQVAYGRQQYAEVATMLTPYRGTILANPDNEMWFSEALIRSLVRLGRFDRAMLEAKEFTDRTGSPWFEAIVHAAAGRHGAAAAAAAALAGIGGDPQAFLTDADVPKAAADEIRQTLGLGAVLKEEHP